MSQIITIPSQFAVHMAEMYGEKGQAWIANLPHKLNELAASWQLTFLPPFKLSYNYVTPVTCADGTTAVLKIGFPHPELFTEMEALRLDNGRSMCKLLAHDPAQYAMLLERIEPGEPLWSLANNEQETRIAARVMQQLWQPASAKTHSSFPTLARYTRKLLHLSDFFEDGFGPFPRRLVETAVSLREELLADEIQPMLLHGDFHHENVLTAQRKPWLALDPKGVIGDPAYEVGAFLYNPICERISQADLACRIDVFHEILGFDKERLINWGIVQAVLSAVWSCEENSKELSSTLLVAEKLLNL